MPGQVHQPCGHRGQRCHLDLGVAILEWRQAREVVKLHPRLVATTSDTAIAAALTGFGLTNVLAYKVDAHLREGRLEAVLGAFEPPALPVHVLHREGRHASQKARTFIDLAVERLRVRLAAL